MQQKDKQNHELTNKRYAYIEKSITFASKLKQQSIK